MMMGLLIWALLPREASPTGMVPTPPQPEPAAAAGTAAAARAPRPVPEWGPGQRPLLLLRLCSLNALLDRARLVGRAIGQLEAVRQLENLLLQYLSPQGTPAVARERPWGAYVLPGRSYTEPGDLVVLAPIQDKERFLDLLRTMNARLTEPRPGCYLLKQLVLPHIQARPDGAIAVSSSVVASLQLRFVEDYACFTTSAGATLEDGRLIPPIRLFADGVPSAISLHLFLDMVPGFSANLGTLEQQLLTAGREWTWRDTNALQEASLRKIVELTHRGIIDLLKHGDELVCTLDLDAMTETLEAAVQYRTRKGTATASRIAALGTWPGLFQHATQGTSDFSASLHLQLPEAIRAALEPVVRDITQRVLEEAKDSGSSEALEKVLRAGEKTLIAGELDLAVALGQDATGGFSMIGGLKLEDARNVEAAFREQVRHASPVYRDWFTFDALQVAGTSLHRINHWTRASPEVAQIAGQQPAFIAWRPDCMLWAAGRDAPEVLRTALQCSPRPVPLAYAQLNLERLLRVVSVFPESSRERGAAQSLQGRSSRLSLQLDGGDALQLRFRLDLSLLSYIVQLKRLDIMPGASGN